MQIKASWGAQVPAFWSTQRGRNHWAPRLTKDSQRRGCKCLPVSALAQPVITSDYGVWSALALAGAAGLWSGPSVVGHPTLVSRDCLCRLTVCAHTVSEHTQTVLEATSPIAQRESVVSLADLVVSHSGNSLLHACVQGREDTAW